MPSEIDVELSTALHLDVSIRSYRAERLSEWVSLVLNGSTDEAHSILKQDLDDYPIFLTRDLNSMKGWLRSHRKGYRRSGLLASSGARRLRAQGLDVQADIEEEHWFLGPADDIRSSSFLELPATEFSVQGLELDFTGVCWGGDFRWIEDGWRFYNFKGTNWQNARNVDRRRYIANKYRVLLTRAREGIVIWVPEGSDQDVTRLPSIYDGTASYLEECGVCRL